MNKKLGKSRMNVKHILCVVLVAALFTASMGFVIGERISSEDMSSDDNSEAKHLIPARDLGIDCDCIVDMSRLDEFPEEVDDIWGYQTKYGYVMSVYYLTLVKVHMERFADDVGGTEESRNKVIADIDAIIREVKDDTKELDSRFNRVMELTEYLDLDREASAKMSAGRNENYADVFTESVSKINEHLIPYGIENFNQDYVYGELREGFNYEHTVWAAGELLNNPYGIYTAELIMGCGNLECYNKICGAA